MAYAKGLLILLVSLNVLCDFGICDDQDDESIEFRERAVDYLELENCTEYRTFSSRLYNKFYPLSTQNPRDSKIAKKTLHFYVVGFADAHIYLSKTNDSTYDQAGHEIAIGWSGNQRCLFRNRRDNVLKQTDTPNVLRPGQPTEVTIEIYTDDLITIFVENKVVIAISVEGVYSNLNFFSFSTNSENFNLYLFNCPKPAPKPCCCGTGTNSNPRSAILHTEEQSTAYDPLNVPKLLEIAAAAAAQAVKRTQSVSGDDNDLYDDNSGTYNEFFSE